MLSELRTWYRLQQQRTGKRLSQLGRGFTAKQLGSPAAPFFKGKAAEARHMFDWVVDQCEANQHRVKTMGSLTKA
eukprot:10037347-Alexandrium_andersonii.AAC.1